jgi:dihydroneopterin aldolase/2-amino-4-hydroxy-6-hydroxymethyldihydropteridine diphosphokinase
VIALGANLGDRAATIRDAASELDETPGIHLLALSPLVESVAVTLDGDDPT